MSYLEALRKHYKFQKKEVIEGICDIKTYNKYSHNLLDAPLKFVYSIADFFGISPEELYYESQIDLLFSDYSQSDQYRLRCIELMNDTSDHTQIVDKAMEEKLVKLLLDFSYFYENKYKNPKYLNIYVLLNNFFPTNIFPKFIKIDFSTLPIPISPLTDKQVLSIERYYWSRFKNNNQLITNSDLQIFANVFLNKNLKLDTIKKLEPYFFTLFQDTEKNPLSNIQPLKIKYYKVILSNYIQFCLSNKHHLQARKLINIFDNLPEKYLTTDDNVVIKIFKLILEFSLDSNHESYLKINNYYQFLKEFGNPTFSKSIYDFIISILNKNHPDDSFYIDK